MCDDKVPQSLFLVQVVRVADSVKHCSRHPEVGAPRWMGWSEKASWRRWFLGGAGFVKAIGVEDIPGWEQFDEGKACIWPGRLLAW